MPSGALGRLSTLRGAIGGGVLAFAGLVVGAGAFMGLRAAGVGPFATLVSAGVLSSKDKLVLADFENRTTDSTLGQSVTEALRIDLTRSTVVRLLEPSDIGAALRRMERDPATPLTATVAQEVATREGAKALIAGEIAPLGAGFVLSARVVSADDGRTLLAERESAGDASQLIAAVDKLSRKVREGIGESLKSIRAGVPLEAVTTSSLEALRKFSQAERTSDQARYEEATALLSDAIRLDSSFAMAWRKLARGAREHQPGLRGPVDRGSRAGVQPPGPASGARASPGHGVLPPERGPGQNARPSRRTSSCCSAGPTTSPPSTTWRSRTASGAGGRTRSGWPGAGEVSTPATGVLWLNLMDALIDAGQPRRPLTPRFRSSGELAPGAQNRFQVGYRRLGQGRLRDGRRICGLGEPPAAGLVSGPRPRAAGRPGPAGRTSCVTSQRLSRGSRRNQRAPWRHVRSRYGVAVALATRDVMLADRNEAALRMLDSVTARYPLDSIPVASRPYLSLAISYARAANVARAESLEREYERVDTGGAQAATTPSG